MELTTLDEEFPLLTIDPNRSTDKPHVSEIIADIERTLGHTYSDWGGRIPMELGFLWEDILSKAFRERLAPRPPELELDGIALSPDGIDVDNWEVNEYKMTFRSVKNLPTENWYWMTQAKAYIKALGKLAEGYATLLMRVLYLMGNWRGSGPIYRAYRVVFSEQEIEENWAMITAHARMRGWI